MILSFRSKALRLAWQGDTSRLTPQVARRIVRVLATLDSATALKDLETQTGFHALHGDRNGTFAITVTRNWRITFIPITETVENPLTLETEEIFGVRVVDYEDYH